MKKSDGAFFVAAQRIIEKILIFQVDKKKRSIRAGYLDDPESLFCEELKVWAAEQLCTWEISKTSGNHVNARIAYLEEVLLTPTLFDDPSTLGEATIQQIIVNTRRVLKYQLLAEIEKELASENAVRSFDELRKHCNIVIYNCYQFLAHVFRAEIEGQITSADKLLKTLQEDVNLKHFMGDSLTEIMDSIHGVKERHEKYTFDLREKGLLPVLNFLEITKLSENDPNLPFIFVGPYSGVEEFFQSNSYITFKFLRAHAILIEFGRLFVVIEKARNCAKQGGTLLVYGVANAQLNALLDSTKAMITAIRDEFTAVCKIAECAFEKLVFENKATTTRCKWMSHFKQVFPASNRINDAVKQVIGDVADIKLMANSMTLYERFQKAQNDTQDFLDSANSFSERTAHVLNQPYKKPEISQEDLQKSSIDNNDVLLQKIQKGQPEV
jgi:DNA-binding transcriptional regulator GbsR (MarR family)